MQVPTPDGGAALAAGQTLEGVRGHPNATIGTVARQADPRSREA
jgi:hypothetical protein